MALKVDLVQSELAAMRAKIADNRTGGCIRWRWFDDDVEALLDYIDNLRRRLGKPPSSDAVDPQASSTGKLSTREDL